MSKRAIRHIICAIWDRYWKAISILGALLVIGMSVSVYIKRSYWNSVLADTWSLVENMSGGTKVSLLVGSSIPYIFCLFKWLFSKGGSELKARVIDEVVKPSLATLGFYVFIALFYMVFWAQPKMYQGKAAEAKTANEELAKLTPPGYEDTPYKTLATELATAKAAAKRASDRAATSDAEKEDFKKRWIDSLSNKSTPSDPSSIDEAIAIVTREHNNASSNQTWSLESEIQYKRDIQSLEEKKAVEATKALFMQGYPVWEYAFVRLQQFLYAPSTNCPGSHPMEKFPSFETLWKDKAATGQIVTNCDWKCGYSAQVYDQSSRYQIEFVWSGKRSPNATMTMWMRHENLAISLNIDNTPTFEKESPISQSSNCIASVEYILTLLRQNQRKEFE